MDINKLGNESCELTWKTDLLEDEASDSELESRGRGTIKRNLGRVASDVCPRNQEGFQKERLITKGEEAREAHIPGSVEPTVTWTRMVLEWKMD